MFATTTTTTTTTITYEIQFNGCSLLMGNSILQLCVLVGENIQIVHRNVHLCYSLLFSLLRFLSTSLDMKRKRQFFALQIQLFTVLIRHPARHTRNDVQREWDVD